MYEAAASCKDIARTPVTNWEPHCVTLAGHCYAVRHGMKVQLVTPYRVTHLQRYAVTLQVWTPLNELQSGVSLLCRYSTRCGPSFMLPAILPAHWRISSFWYYSQGSIFS
jgi:hypothetical protein